jgi:predicted nucleic acid-binding protein
MESLEAPTLVDSNVFISLLRRGLDPAATLTETVSSTDLATCGMVRMEVLRGIKNPRVRDGLAGFFDVLQNVPTDNRLWEEAATVAWKLDRTGKILPAQDVLIAVSAMRIGAVVLTADRHFEEIPGLRVRWWIG